MAVDLERVGATLLSQQTNPDPLEDELLRADVRRMWAAAAHTQNPGSSRASGVAFVTGSQAYHKPRAGIDTGQAAMFGHDDWSVLINESAASRLALSLGQPYSEWVPTTVLRSLRAPSPNILGGWGCLSQGMPGRAGLTDPLHDQAYCDPAALWDSLIGQQDRHGGQYRFDRNVAGAPLGLIDSGYAFAAPDPKYFAHASVFVEQRHNDKRAALRPQEVAVLQAFLADQDLLHALQAMLRSDQFGALVDRAQRMINAQSMLGVLEF